MLFITGLIGIVTSVFGYYLAAYIDGSIAGAMSTVSGIIFLICFFFSPTEGLLVKKIRANKQATLVAMTKPTRYTKMCGLYNCLLNNTLLQYQSQT